MSRDKIPQVITRFYLSPRSPPTFEVVLTRFGSLTSPYVPLGHQSGSALGLQLCNIWASWGFCSRWHYHHLEWCVEIVSWLCTSVPKVYLFSFAITITWSAFLSRIWESFRYLFLCVNGWLVHHSFYLFTTCSSAGFSQLHWSGV